MTEPKAPDERSKTAEAWDVEAHRRALLLRRRCGQCAERVGPAVLLQGKPCPSCGQPLTWPAAQGAESLIEAVSKRWRRRRFVVYPLVALSTGLTGFLPLLPTLVATAFMIALRYSFMREPLRWFGPKRRLVTGINLKLWLVTISCVTLFFTSLLSLVPFANVVLNAVVCLATTALFTEVALYYLWDRLRYEAESGPDLEGLEWGFPAGLASIALVTCAAGVGAALLTWELIAGFLR